MIKKYLVGLLAASAFSALSVFAATPVLTISGNGSDANMATVNVSGGDINTPIVLYYTGTDGTVHSQTIGSTNANGTFSGNLNVNTWGINQSVPAYVMVNGYQSGTISWPNNNNGYSYVSSGPGYASAYNYSNGSYSGSYSTSNGNVTFSNNNPIVATGGNGSLTLSGGNGSGYYIVSSSNNGAISSSISGNTLSYSASRNGTSVVTVCPIGQVMNANCRNITITANGSASQNSNANTSSNGVVTINSGTTTTSVITFSQNSPSVVIGTPMGVTISGGTAPYTVTPISGTNVTTQLTGGNLTLSGTATGVATFNVCDVNRVCSVLTVNAGTTTPTTTTSASAFPFSLSLALNQVVKLNMTGQANGGSFYLQSPMSSPVMASMTGNTLTVMGTAFGQATVTVCQNGVSTCIPINFSVDRSADTTGTGTTALTGTGGPFIFNTNLWIGDRSNDVMELQNFLIGEGYLSAGLNTGFFGQMTLDAVRRFQVAHGLAGTGYVGDLTRAAMNNAGF